MIIVDASMRCTLPPIQSRPAPISEPWWTSSRRRSVTRRIPRATRRTLRHRRLQVGVELKAVAVWIAHVELTGAPIGVSDIGAVDKRRVLPATLDEHGGDTLGGDVLVVVVS